MARAKYSSVPCLHGIPVTTVNAISSPSFAIGRILMAILRKQCSSYSIPAFIAGSLLLPVTRHHSTGVVASGPSCKWAKANISQLVRVAKKLSTSRNSIYVKFPGFNANMRSAVNGLCTSGVCQPGQTYLYRLPRRPVIAALRVPILLRYLT